MECLSYCLADKIDLHRLERHTKTINHHFKVSRYSRVLMLSNQENNNLCVFFSNGTLVTWGIKRHLIKPYITLALKCAHKKLDNPHFEGLSYTIAQKTEIKPHNYFNVDCLGLENDDPELMLSLSYGLSQSIKLKYHENKLDQLVSQYTPLTSHLVKTGQMRVSRKRIQKIIGEIILVKTELNLISDLLYQPKFFWQHATFEQEFLNLQRYLDISERTAALNEKLNTLNEIFVLFNEYLETSHGHRLEVIIIVLIAIEIIFNILNFHF